MTTYPDLVDLGIENTTSEIRRILRQYPAFMQDSYFHQLIATIVAQEIDSRAKDLLDSIYRNARPALVEEMGIPYWQTLLDYPSLHGDTLEVARARILSKTVRSERRVTDIANIVRLYLSGNRTYTADSAIDSNLVIVNSTDGFIVGQLIWIGPVPAIIESIDVATSSFILDRQVTAHIFELVSDSPVIITQVFPLKNLYDSDVPYNSFQSYDADNSGAYLFYIFVEKARILSLPNIIEAVTNARPAHLNFMILSYPPITYNDPNYTYNGVFVNSALYNNASPYNTGGLTYNGVSDLGSYDSPTQPYDNPLRRYDDPNTASILYNGSEVLFGGY